MKTLPKYFAIKRDATNPLWKKYIDWLNENYESNWSGNENAYYGNIYLNGKGNWQYDVSSLSANPIILTLKEWDEIINGFVLPKKWCIKQASTEEVCEWFRKKRHTYSANPTGRACKYMCYDSLEDKSAFKAIVPEGYKEITVEQFKKYVLNQTEMKKIFVKVINSGKSYSTHSSAKKYGCTNYHYWKNLPGAENGDILEVVKEIVVNGDRLSYILKDKDDIEYIIEINGVSLVKDNTIKKEIIGYKLKENYKQYLKATYVIAGYLKNITIPLEYYLKKENWGSFKKNLEKAGVLDLWFEPVYKEEFEVGDWVVVLPEDEYYCNAEQGKAQQIAEIYKEDLLPYYLKFSDGSINNYKKIRKATQEEIKQAQQTKFKFGNLELTHQDSNRYFKSKFGDIYFNKIVDVWEELECAKDTTILGYPLTIPTIKFGCVEGTFEELKKIYNYICDVN